MQQTQNYQLNLIETDDVFSPNPLNENAQKLEAALAGVTEAAAALEDRVTVVETQVRRIVVGQYVGKGPGQPQTIELGFTPKAVIVSQADCRTGSAAMAVEGFLAYETNANDYPVIVIIPGGFQIGNTRLGAAAFNGNEIGFNFLALA